MSNNNSKHKAVWDWLMTCPHIKDLFFQFTNAQSENTAIVPSEEIIESYIDGCSLRSYNVGLVQYQELSDEPNDETNIGGVDDFELIESWIEEQNETKNFPQFPNGETVVDITVSPNIGGIMAEQTDRLAKLMCQFTITYVKGA